MALLLPWAKPRAVLVASITTALIWLCLAAGPSWEGICWEMGWKEEGKKGG